MKLVFLIVWVLSTTLCIQAQKSSVVLQFENMYGDAPLAFKQDYVNAHGEKMQFTLLNYFISNIQLERTDGTTYILPQDSSYFLVKQNLPESKEIRLNVPSGKYRSVQFTIGVDSLRSTMGADRRQGVLDVGAQARGMYWQWNSGYIFFKMEGKSSASPDSFKNNFYYHIGGYGGYDSKTLNNIRQITFEFEKPLHASSEKPVQIPILVDIKKFFEGNPGLQISKYPSIMWGPVSTQIADTYVGIFSLKEGMKPVNASK